MRLCLGGPSAIGAGHRIPAGASRCREHALAYQRAVDAKRGTTAQRGYGPEYQRARRAILAEGGECAWGCGRPATTVDHRIPLAHGGTNVPDNLMPSCAPCNYSRGSRPAPSYWIRRPHR